VPAIDAISVSARMKDTDGLSVETLRVESVTLTCPYCAASMPAAAFRVWPSEPRLITGECKGCARSVTLPSRWLTTPSLVRQR
jgi:hypothetical protein